VTLKYTIRPLGPWVGPETPPAQRRGAHVFRASWADTLDLLGRELEHLGASNVVLQVDVREGDLRVDGMLRANAKVGRPGVRISFDSKHGPLTYATDVYETGHTWARHQPWQANVRAIALAPEALRAVDRHGVSRTGEQYRGWRAIDAGPGEGTGPLFLSDVQAAGWVAEAHERAGLGEVAPTSLVASSSTYVRVYRALVRRLHPDVGGDTADWARLDAAHQLLADR
jgi:hypothetical protein